MSVICCYYIIDATCLCELVSVSDSRGLHFEYLKISKRLSKQQFLTHSQYFVYIFLSRNLRDCKNPNIKVCFYKLIVN